MLYPPDVWPDIADPLLPGLATLARVNITLPPEPAAAPLNFSAQQDVYRGWTHVQLVDAVSGRQVLSLDSTIAPGERGNVLMTNVTLAAAASGSDSANLIISTITVPWTVDGHVFPTTAGCSGADRQPVDCQQAASGSGAVVGDYVTRAAQLQGAGPVPAVRRSGHAARGAAG